MRASSFFHCVVLAAFLAAPVDVWAKGKKSKVAAPEAPAKKKVTNTISGKLPPIPKPAVLDLNFATDASDSAVFASMATFATTVSGPVTTAVQHVRVYTIASWKRQMVADSERLSQLADRLAARLTQSQRNGFVVPTRYLRSLYDSASQFEHLALKVRREYDDLYPSDRNAELAPTPPPAARRVRLYVDKVMGLDQSADAYVRRTTQSDAEKITRLKD